MVRIRPFEFKDYDLLLEFANEAVPFDPEGNQVWLEYRKAFDESDRFRYHCIAYDAGKSIGYGCLEQQGEDRQSLRIYIVCDPKRLSEVGSRLYDHLLKIAQKEAIHDLWARENQADQPIRDFFIAKGFVEEDRFIPPDGLPMVVFRLHYRPVSP